MVIDDRSRTNNSGSYHSINVNRKEQKMALQIVTWDLPPT